MFSAISQKLTKFLLNKDVIQKENLEIYQFGIEQFLTTFLNILTTLILGILFNEVFQGILFVIAFMILRAYSGGYHASTPIKCYLFSTFSIAVALSVMKFIEINNFICIGLLLLSGIVIILLSPVSTVNKPLDNIERVVYRKKAIFIWCTETCAALIFIGFNISKVSVCIMLAQVLISIALVFGQTQCRN